MDLLHFLPNLRAQWHNVASDSLAHAPVAYQSHAAATCIAMQGWNTICHKNITQLIRKIQIG